MRQRVAIARTLAVKPQIILMDEPFGALDVQTRLGMQNLINELWEEIEGTILFVTHDIAEAVYLADKIHILSSGPGTLVDEIDVDLPLHRTEDLKQTARFRELETIVLDTIRARPRAATSASRPEPARPRSCPHFCGHVPNESTYSRDVNRGHPRASRAEPNPCATP